MTENIPLDLEIRLDKQSISGTVGVKAGLNGFQMRIGSKN